MHEEGPFYRRGRSGLSAQSHVSEFFVTDLVQEGFEDKILFALKPLDPGAYWHLVDLGYERLPGQRFPYGFLVEPDNP